MSMVDFVCAEYSAAQAVADKKARKRIVEIGLKKIARETGIDRNTLRLIVRGKAVKPKTLARITDFIERRNRPTKSIARVVHVEKEKYSCRTGMRNVNANGKLQIANGETQGVKYSA